jgi:hypothetical protein
VAQAASAPAAMTAMAMLRPKRIGPRSIRSDLLPSLMEHFYRV